MFSLGVIFLELVVGWPVWLNMQCKIHSVLNAGEFISTVGLFSTNLSFRDNAKIRDLQLQTISNLDNVFETSMGLSNISDDGKDLLRKMLLVDGSKRISPMDALNHPFLL
mmetsp:Transcript_21752/g.48588  ORF Transcript_21752/g.48588 Transcript_21752/m.48588 type:complete len:110 (-) Transcript_21752:176-505(-)